MQRPTPEEIDVRNRFFEAPPPVPPISQRLEKIGEIVLQKMPQNRTVEDSAAQTMTLSERIRQASQEALDKTE
jgi:hypothetical protein